MYGYRRSKMFQSLLVCSCFHSVCPSLFFLTTDVLFFVSQLPFSKGLLETLRVPQSLGFLGGRPNHAIFFIGAQGTTCQIARLFRGVLRAPLFFVFESDFH